MKFDHEWRFIDKAQWDRGEWDDEPDKAQWVDPATGYACLIHRGPAGALCGYVGVPQSHPLHGKEYDEADVDVHGGLTFSDLCRPADEATGRGICHVGEDKVWWFGFDCAHSGDFSPSYTQHKDTLWQMSDYETYKSVGYVVHQTTGLAGQLKALATEN